MVPVPIHGLVSGVKYSNLAKCLEITWNFAQMIEYVFFPEKNHFEPVKLIFASFQNFTYDLSQSMIWYLGKSGVKYGNLAKCLEITWNFAQMIEYVFFPEKNHFEPVKLIFASFQNFTYDLSQSMIWYLGKSGVKYGNLAKCLEITWNFAQMIEYVFFPEKNHFEPVKLIFASFQNFTYDLSQSMIWYLGKSGVKYGNLAKCLEITWNFAQMIEYVFFPEKNHFEPVKLIFASFQNFTYDLSQSMIWYVGKSGVKYGNLAKCLEITWNFAQMIEYVFFPEKNHFEPVKLIFASFQNFTYDLSQSMIWYLGKSGVKYGNLAKCLEITWNFAQMIEYVFFPEKNHFEPVKLIFASFQNFTYDLSQSMIWYLGWNMVTWQNVLKSLETLHKWLSMCSFLKKIILSQLNSFLQVFKISPMICPNPWFGIWGNLGWNMVTWQNVLKSLETLHKWLSMSSFLKKIILSQLNSFLQVVKISPMVCPNPWFGIGEIWGEIW